MLCRSTFLTAILLVVFCYLIQGVLASGYEALCVAALENDALNDSTAICCDSDLVDADLITSVPPYWTCANMSDGQLKEFIKCCPIIVHVGSSIEDHHNGKNNKRSIGRRDNKRRDNNQ
jgi:hypothetical protein